MKREFDFGNSTMTVRANLREQVAWIKDTSDDAPEEHDEYINEIGQDYVPHGCGQCPEDLTSQSHIK